MKVLKFGGTSMADEQTWLQILGIIKSYNQPVIVVSATSGTTNSLLQAAELARIGRLEDAYEMSQQIDKKHQAIISKFLENNKVAEPGDILSRCTDWIEGQIKVLNNYLLGINTLGEYTPKSMDLVSSIGERLSSFLLAECGKAIGMPTVFINASDVLKTNSDYGKAAPDMKRINESVSILRAQVENNRVPIVGGFFGSNESGEITTLGRGGSDYSASIFGMALDAESIEIWTDVDGMFTSDPRYIKNARFIDAISFNEAAELAYFGAKVLHPATIQPAVEKNIPVFIKNTFKPEQTGTRIASDVPTSDIIRAIAFKKDITVVTIASSRMLMAYGFLARVFNIFEEFRVSVDLVSTSEVSISMSVDNSKNLDQVIKELRKIGNVSIREHQTLISVVGRNFLDSKGLASRSFGALEDIPIHMISQGSSDINLSLIVDNENAISAVQALHDEFFN